MYLFYSIQREASVIYLDVFNQLILVMGILLVHFRYKFFLLSEGRNSAASVATRYELDGPGFKYRWGRDFPYLTSPAMGPTQHHIKWVPVLPQG